MNTKNQQFYNKTLLITGGTGSFGKAVLSKFASLSEMNEIRVFSRDEKKQDDLRNIYRNKNISFYIGDVRNYNSINRALRGVDYVFHAAALKQVPSCEFHPMEAYKTNVEGTENVIEASINNSVEKVICLSTDKAVYPVNAMGMSKAMMEKLVVSRSFDLKTVNTKLMCTRYGNVMASRGSVIPLFLNQIKNNLPITATDLNMTRFMMTLEHALDLVLFAFTNGENGDIFVKKSPAISLGNLIKALLDLFDLNEYQTDIIGIRHGEKTYESLLSSEEQIKSVDLGDYFKVPHDPKKLDYSKYIDKGNVEKIEDYNSNNTKQLNNNEMKDLLLELPIVKTLLKQFDSTLIKQ